MAKPYKRCKVCFVERATGVPISRNGLCRCCALDRQIVVATKQRDALEAFDAAKVET